MQKTLGFSQTLIGALPDPLIDGRRIHAIATVSCSIWNIGSGARERADAARAPARDDSLAGQRLALVSEQRASRTVDMVAATFRPASGIAQPPPQNGSRPSRALLRLFYQVEIRDLQLLKG
jgi:hypothetical protein